MGLLTSSQNPNALEMANGRLERTMRHFSKATLVNILALLGTFASPCWAQDKAEETRDPAGFSIAFEWNYSCPSSKGCAFNCPGAGGATHVTQLTIYLGKLRISENEKPSLYSMNSQRQSFRAAMDLRSIPGSTRCRVKSMV